MIEIDSAVNYIITENRNGILSKVTPAGTRTVVYDFTVECSPTNVAIDPSGNYIVAGGGYYAGMTEMYWDDTLSLSKVTPTGVRTVIYNFGGIGSPRSLPHAVVYLALPPSAVTLSNPTEVTENSMKLSWTACTDSDFKNYTVYKSTDQGNLGTPITAITNNATTSYVATGLSAERALYFKISNYFLTEN